MFKLNSDPQDKFQPIPLRDWSKGEVTDVDSVDMPADSVNLIKNLLFKPGKLCTPREDSDTALSGVITANPSRIFTYETPFNTAGSATPEEWIVYIDEDNTLYRMYDNAGTWTRTQIDSDISVDDPVFSAYEGILTVARGLSYDPMNYWYQVAKTRFNNTNGDGNLAAGWILDSETFDPPTVEGYNHTDTSNYTPWRTPSTYGANHVGLRAWTSVATGGTLSVGDIVEMGASLVRFDGEESAIGIWNVDEAVVGSGTCLEWSLNLGLDEFDPRCASIKVYYRVNSGNWFLLEEVDINTGYKRAGVQRNWSYGTDTGTYLSDMYYCDGGQAHAFPKSVDGEFTFSMQTGFPETTQTTHLRYELATNFGNRRICANVSHNGTTYYNRIYVSPAGAPHSFPDDNYIDLLEDSEVAFTGIAIWNRLLFLFKETQLFVVDVRPASEASWRVIDRRNFGAFSELAITVGVNGIYFANEVGVFWFDGESFHNITKDKIEEEYLDSATSSNVFLGFDKKTEHLIMEYGGTYERTYDRYGRWATEDSSTTETNITNLISTGTAIWMYKSGSYHALVQRHMGSVSKHLPGLLETQILDFGTSYNKIIRRLELRFKLDHELDFPYGATIKAAWDGAAYATLATTTMGVQEGASKFYRITLPLKKRFKTVQFQIIIGGDDYYYEILNLTAWLAPRKGRVNA